MLATFRKIRYALAAVLLAALFVALSPTVASAAAVDAGAAPTIVFAPDWVLVLTFIVGTALPVLTGLVTKTVTSARRKALILLGLSAVTGLLSELLAAVTADVTYDLFSGLMTALGVFILGVAFQFGFWRPSGVTATVQAVGDKGSIAS